MKKRYLTEIKKHDPCAGSGYCAIGCKRHAGFALKLCIIPAIVLTIFIFTLTMLQINASAEGTATGYTVIPTLANLTELSKASENGDGKTKATESNAVAGNILSPALNNLAYRSAMAKWTLTGNDIYFCADDFCRALNRAEIDYVTVTALPDQAFGSLVLGSTPVTKGQTISASNLALLKYISADASGDKESLNSFEFSCGNVGYTMACNLYILKKNNYAPTVQSTAKTLLTLSTYNDITVHSILRGYDPDGDDISFEIVSYPKNGYIKMDTSAKGKYTYTPKAGYHGKDSFMYIVKDKYGNASAATTVALTINRRKTSVVFSDLDESEYQSHAVSMTEAGIMSGTQIGNGYYFYPDQTVSRVEFLVMAMNSVGITEVANVKDTVFFDDNDIPVSMKGYVAAAYRLGYVGGTVENGELYFKPDEALTRAEAAYILCNLLGIDSKPTTVAVFTDSVPSWAENAVYTMSALGILRENNGKISSYAKLTRGQAAQMLDCARGLR